MAFKAEELANYLHYLSENDEEYLKYFEWRRVNKLQHYQAFCKLCEMLHDPSLPAKSYPNIHKWWIEDAKCGQDVLKRKLKLKSNEEYLISGKNVTIGKPDNKTTFDN